MNRSPFVIVGLLALGLAAPAIAADIPVKARPAPVPAPFSWTGLYIGFNGGYGWGDKSSLNLVGANADGQAFIDAFGGLTPRSGSLNTSGAVFGGQIGYNWQFAGQWVGGIEADINYSDVNGRDSFVARYGIGTDRIDGVRSLDWFGTVRARLGFLAQERFLVFATAGLAYGRGTARASLTDISNTSSTVNGTIARPIARALPARARELGRDGPSVAGWNMRSRPTGVSKPNISI
jgi:outer membrane immunogenic protein